jgi:sugar lactone lactonase YvrE
MPEIELLLDCRAIIGESPTWFAPEQVLYWIDVRAPSLHRLSADGLQAQWLLDADIGAFALLEGATGALVALRTRIFRLDFASGDTELLAPPPFDPNLFRFNEGVSDDEGRFWVGVMFDPRPGVTAQRAEGPIHRFTFGEGLVAGDDWSDLHNGFAWSAAEDAFFLSHSHAREVLRAPYDRTSGRLGKRGPFAEIRTEGHVPDGAAMDEEGCYWCAVHGGGVLHRYDPSGDLIAQVALPISQPTMCAFVGPELDEMVVTSARQKLSEDELKREPHAGGLFRFRPGVRGLPRPCIVR